MAEHIKLEEQAFWQYYCAQQVFQIFSQLPGNDPRKMLCMFLVRSIRREEKDFASLYEDTKKKMWRNFNLVNFQYLGWGQGTM